MTGTQHPSRMPFHYVDPVVGVELRATTYAYGAGQPGVGIQITLESQWGREVVALRLPHEKAASLALKILAALDGRE